MRLVHWGLPLVAAVVFAGATAVGGCSDLGEKCDRGECDNTTTVGGTGGSGGSAGSGGTGGDTGGSAGSGGSDPCGGCSEPTPMCDTNTNQCVACLEHGDCMDADVARCDDSGSCVDCENSPECVGVSEGEVCLAGDCVECAVGEEDACSGQETCDLLASECVGVEPGDVENCEACTNDAQCADGRCIPMEFESSDHGHFCLAEPSPGCSQPFGVAINRASINGVAATDYCGIEEDLATCEAVLALLGGWYCTGTDGMCSVLDGGQEVPVPGATCEQVGLLGDRCTYACDSAPQCPSGAPQNTCGEDGNHTPPGWCGG